MPLKKPVKEQAYQAGEGERRRLKRDLDGLMVQLFSPLPSERRWAARDIAGFPEASEALIQALKREPDISVREVIVSSLLQIGDGIAIEGLLQLLKSDDAHLRNASIEALKQVSDKLEPHIEDLLSQEDPDIRIFAVNIMEAFESPRIAKLVARILEEDEDVNVCSAALNLAAQLGEPSLTGSIMRAKERFPEEPYVGFAAAVALERINVR
ncbi:MAG: HEAT repeat domain-containing protein [Candidatus Methanomethylicaceae archaeon]